MILEETLGKGNGDPMMYRRKDLIEELYTVDGKAEIVNDMIVMDSPTGGMPGRAAARIYRSLDDYEREQGGGYAIADNVGFIVNLPNRQSFSPDAAFYVGEMMMKFLDGAPIFAAEVRSEGDYGPAEEARMRLKRADYFMAGTQVVWDVDLLGDDIVKVYTSEDSESPRIYGHGEIAEAESVLPGWTMAVDELF
jgi:Uma2 family endonuclease